MSYSMPYKAYGSGLASSAGFAVAAFILAIVATVLAFIFIVPEKRRAKLNAFGRFLHDTCNFKYLVVEKILQTLYIFATALVILSGFFMLFQSTYGHWLGGAGIAAMLLGPIAIRLVYELLMMVVILVKNVIGINKKLKNQNDGAAGSADVFAAPDMVEMREAVRQKREAMQAQAAERAAQAQAPAADEKPRFCVNCGSPLDEAGNCPNCSAK